VKTLRIAGKKSFVKTLQIAGGKDNTVKCPNIKDIFLSVKDQPAFFINEKDSDHGNWVYLGPSDVWFRVHLMNDTANRNYFYGPNCTFCTERRVAKVAQNSFFLTE
jgi:hypothetical protein